MGRPWQRCEVLKELYVQQGLSQSEVAEELGCSLSVVNKWINYHNIEKPKQPRPWQDSELMKTLYIEKAMSQTEIADELGCGESTVSRWLDKHNIQRRTEPLRSKETLESMYIDDMMSTTEIANEVGCSQAAVSEWLRRHNIDTRKSNDEKVPYFCTDKYGYESWSTLIVGVSYRTVRVHRLLMVAEEGFDAVCDMEVHHKNEIKWDNRVKNLELMTPKEHRQHHHST